MAIFPEDIFTEPGDVDPDTLANLGPLRRLAGTWRSARRAPMSRPRRKGPERRVNSSERIVLEPIDPQANGPQLFYGSALPRPHHHRGGGHHLPRSGGLLALGSRRPGWCCRRWRSRAGRSLLASGQGEPGAMPACGLSATRGETEYGICSTAFLEDAFRTDAYSLDVKFHSNGDWSYVSNTTLIVRGRSEPFAHKDQNRLHKVAEPVPNPLFVIEAGRKG
jgi:hypothetical protein